MKLNHRFIIKLFRLKILLIHKVKVLNESKNGVVIDLNTDACTCIFPDDKFPLKMLDNENLDDFFYDKTHRCIN